MSGRREVLEAVADHVARLDLGHPVRVGIDGVCGAGKTTFARELASVVRAVGRPVIHLDSDGFHHVRDRRRRNAADPARGYYEDAYDLDAVASRVLRPLGPGGDRRYAAAVHDLASDQVLDIDDLVADPDAVVLLDMTFLQRGALRELWDEVVFLDVDHVVATDRGVRRDASALGGIEAARSAWERRYMAACQIYLAEEDPAARASVVIEHSHPQDPVLKRLGPAI